MGGVPPIEAPTPSIVGASHLYRSWIGGVCDVLETQKFWIGKGASELESDALVTTFSQIISDLLEGRAMHTVGEITSGLMLEMPSGWIPMNGQWIPTASYPLLADIMPSHLIIGDDMLIPDMTWRVPIGAGVEPYVVPVARLISVGETGGESKVTIGINQMPSHAHTPSSGTAFITTVVGVGGAAMVAGTNIMSQATTNNTGGGQPHNNIQPFLGVKYYIYGG